MSKYKYELHCHCCEVSPCAKASYTELADFYKSEGYTGFCITNHLYESYAANGGNTDFENNIRWFFRCSNDIKKYCEKIGIDVFFGWERGFEGNDFLTYGLPCEWLLGQRDIFSLKAWEYCARVRESGGYIIHAHPFREAEYIKQIILLPRCVDGVEIYNSCRTNFENEMALQYAENYGLPGFSGSDNHVGYIENAAAVYTDIRAESAEDIIKNITNEAII